MRPPFVAIAYLTRDRLKTKHGCSGYGERNWSKNEIDCRLVYSLHVTPSRLRVKFQPSLVDTIFIIIITSSSNIWMMMIIIIIIIIIIMLIFR